LSTEISEQQILDALSQVIDPELGKDIVSLEFIKNLRIAGGDVSLDLELTTTACPLKDKLKSEVEAAVNSVEGVNSVSVSLTARAQGAGAQERKEHSTDPWAGRAPIPGVDKIIAVASGKGGVGKSTVAVNLATALAADGMKVGLLDADVYGPSVAMMMGVDAEEQLKALGEKIIPIERHGVKMMSIAFLMQGKRSAVIWRGPMVASLAPAGYRRRPADSGADRSDRRRCHRHHSSAHRRAGRLARNRDVSETRCAGHRPGREHEQVCLPRLRSSARPVPPRRSRGGGEKLQHAGDRPRSHRAVGRHPRRRGHADRYRRSRVFRRLCLARCSRFSGRSAQVGDGAAERFRLRIKRFCDISIVVSIVYNC